MKDHDVLEDATSDTYRVTADELRQIIERVERLEQEKKDIAEQVKEVFAEAKGRGYDTKVLAQGDRAAPPRQGRHRRGGGGAGSLQGGAGHVRGGV